MKKILVYDFPTRFFHWLYAGLFLTAFIIGKTVDDESAVFSYHMMAGLSLGFVLLLRLMWGFVGTKYARFSSFKLNPAELIRYFTDVFTGKGKRYAGHNPASSYAALVMFLCTLGLGFTGIAMATGPENEFYEEIHELFANLFVITVIAHLAGLVIHNLKHGDGLWASMLDGKKEPVENETGIANARPVAGLLFLVLSFVWIGYLNGSYDSSTRTLNLFGTELRVSEEEHESEQGSEGEEDEAGEEEEHEYEEDD